MKLSWDGFSVSAKSKTGDTQQIYWSELLKLEVAKVIDSPIDECIFYFYLSGQKRLETTLDINSNRESLYKFQEAIRNSLGDNSFSDWVTPLEMMQSSDPIVIWSKDDEEKSKSDFFQTLYVKNWEEAKIIGKYERGRVFRGQSNVSWMLSTSIERAFERAHSAASAGYATTRAALLPSCEADMLYEFKRKASLYEANLPNEESIIEWLSLMQHYGCPTRLLDFTNSFYVAAFFAISQANRDEDVAIWSISRYGLASCSQRHLGTAAREKDLERNKDAVKVFNDVVANGLQFSGLLVLEPNRLNNRISAQQGLFVAPLDIRKSFEGNLLSLADYGESTVSLDSLLTANTKQYDPKTGEVSIDLDAVVVKIVIPSSEIHEIRRDLKRMNVTYETLFPGLEGYARSLENLVYHQ